MRRSLTSSIITGFALVAVVPVGLLALLLGAGERRREVDEASPLLAANARLVGGYLRQYAETHRAVLTTTARGLDGAPPSAYGAALRRMRLETPGFLTAVVLDANGTVVAQSPAPGEGAVPVVGQSLAERSYFQRAVASDSLIVSEAMEGRGFGRAPIVAMARRFRTARGTIAVVEASLNLTALGRIARDMREDRQLVVTDARGSVLWASPAVRLAPLQRIPTDAEGQAAWLHRLPEATVGRFATAGNGWVVGVLQTEASLLAGSAWEQSLLVVAGLALLLGLLLALLLARRITGPLEVVSRWLNTVDLADVDAEPAPRELPVEVAALVAHIEHSALRVRKSCGELQVAVVQRDHLNGEMRELLATLDGRVAERTLQLQEALRDAERANLVKSRFLANMSHELRTPLNSVIGFAGVLLKNRSGAMSASELGMVERIRTNGRHLLALINDVLDVSKIEAGRLTLELRAVDVARLARETVEELEGQVVGKPVRLAVEGPSTWVLATDEARLRQVLVNLVGNAAKFTLEGSVTVRLDAGGQRIEVRDTGIGIPAERLESIFVPFEQADNSTSRRFGGTGLGLSICRSICEALGARLTVESTPGQGSVFSIRFASGAVPVVAAPAGEPIPVEL